MTRIMMRLGLIGLVCACLASVAWAVPIEVNLVPVDNSAGGAELEGFTTTDIVLTIPGVHTGAQLFIELDQGSIYQHPLGHETTPAAGGVELYPALGYDTYLAYGSHFGAPFGSYALWGAAVNLDQEVLPRPLTFGDSSIDVAWGPSVGGNLPEEVAGFLSARITLSDDAMGRWLYLASSGDEFTVIAPEGHLAYSFGPTISAGSGVIRFGELRLAAKIPEPAAVSLVASLSATGLLFHWVRRLLPRGKPRVQYPD